MYQDNALTCRLLVFCNFYFELAMYHWLLVEGIYLYMKVALVYNSERIKLWMYKLVGWVRVNNKKTLTFDKNWFYSLRLQNSGSNRKFNNYWLETNKKYFLLTVTHFGVFLGLL